jgi:hypothetical protein
MATKERAMGSAARAWTTLALVPGLTPRRVTALAEALGGAEAVVGAGAPRLAAHGVRRATAVAIAAAQAGLPALLRSLEPDVRIVT